MRLYRIVKLFLNYSQFMTLESLATTLKVSTRTIRTDIDELMKDADKQGFEILERPKKGYYLVIHDSEKFQLYFETLKEIDVKTPERRRNMLYMNLLFQNSYQTIANLSELLQVSKSQIKIDLKKLIQEKNIVNQLERRAHYGIRLTVSFEERLVMMIEHYYAADIDFLTLYQQFIDTAVEEQLVHFVDTLLTDSQLQYRDEQLTVIYQKYFITYAFIAFNNQMLLPAGFSEATFRKLLETPEFKSCADYLAYLIADQSKVLDLPTVDRVKIEHEIEQFFRKIDDLYQTNMSEDQEFMRLIKLHIQALIGRQPFQEDCHQPLTIEMSQRYAQEFDFSLKLADMLEEAFNIQVTAVEVGLICTHLAVHFERHKYRQINNYRKIAIVCSSGGGSAHLIKLQLSYLFTDATIQTFALNAEEKISAFMPDIIFSIKPLRATYQVPVVLINELGLDLTPNTLLEAIAQQSSNVAENDKQAFLSLFDKHYFGRENQVTYPQLLAKMANQLEADGIVEAGFKQSVLERENLLSTLYGERLAMPHPLELLAKQNQISVALFQPTPDEPVKIIFLLAIQGQQVNLIRMITEKIFQLLGKEQTLRELSEASSFEEFYVILKNSL
ncbi:BglG family transcription antiterminator [Latilactobacillus sakei]|uniref:BglG family transcription antiterminator n=1 Tax=Latilactobacillus sakei TaxID=1599 RepID=UPI003F529DEE